MARDDPQHLPVEAVDESTLGLAEAHRVLGQRLEYRFEVERGSSDHLERFASRGLLFECDAQLAVARLQLLEQPHILDRDDRLVGET